MMWLSLLLCSRSCRGFLFCKSCNALPLHMNLMTPWPCIHVTSLFLSPQVVQWLDLNFLLFLVHSSEEVCVCALTDWILMDEVLSLMTEHLPVFVGAGLWGLWQFCLFSECTCIAVNANCCVNDFSFLFVVVLKLATESLICLVTLNSTSLITNIFHSHFSDNFLNFMCWILDSNLIALFPPFSMHCLTHFSMSVLAL